MRAMAAELAMLPGFVGIEEQRLASLLVGRWPSGAPVNRTPAADNYELGNDALANNNFQFDSNGLLVKLAGNRRDGYPQAEGRPTRSDLPVGSPC